MTRRSFGRCPYGLVVQTLLFSKGVYELWDVVSWLYEHDYSPDQVEETRSSYRARQHAPSEFVAGSFRTIRLGHGTSDVQAVVACPRASLHARLERLRARRRRRKR